jgi:hypothetical protein
MHRAAVDPIAAAVPIVVDVPGVLLVSFSAVATPLMLLTSLLLLVFPTYLASLLLLSSMLLLEFLLYLLSLYCF